MLQVIETFDVFDKNLTLDRPVGFNLRTVDAKGEYIRLGYRREKKVDGYDAPRITTIEIFLNSDGKEVLRTMHEWLRPNLPPAELVDKYAGDLPLLAIIVNAIKDVARKLWHLILRGPR